MPTQAISTVETIKQQWDGTAFNDITHSHVAAFNPIVVEFQRKDVEGNLNISSNDTSKMMFSASSLAVNYPVGSLVYVNGGVLDGFYEVLFNNGTEVEIDFNYIGSSYTCFFNSTILLNWYLTLRLNGSGGAYRDIRLTPDETGYIRAEISGMVKSMLSLDYSVEFLPSTDPSYQINKVDTNLSKSFNLTWKENWIGSDEAFTTNSPGENQFYAHAGVFQIGDPANGYYNDYLANYEGSNSYMDFLPDWLTMFPKPVYFIGYPFTVSALMGKNLGAVDGYRLNRALFDSYGAGFSTQNIDLAAVSQGNINVFDMNYDDVDATLLDSMSLRLRRLTGGKYILKWLKVNVTRASEQHCNAMYLKWLNPLGGWDYYLFQNRIVEADRVESMGTFETYFDSIAAVSDYQNFVGKLTTPQVTIGVDSAPNNDMIGLKYLKKSPKVYWYNTAISKWIGVRVDVGTFTFRESNIKYNKVELTVSLPTELNQTA